MKTVFKREIEPEFFFPIKNERTKAFVLLNLD